MMYRRNFIELLTAGLIGIQQLEWSDPDTTAKNFWKDVSKSFPDSKSKKINLNNGSAGMMPSIVENQLLSSIKEMNRMPPYQKFTEWEPIRVENRRMLSQMLDCKPEELAIVRNTTEAASIIISRLELTNKSKILMANFDYLSLTNMIEQRAEEKGYKIERINLNLPTSRENIIAAYEEKLDEDVGFLLLTAMTHREGQMLPIKDITALAHKKGVRVLVDAAHSIGHYEHSISDWNCDYYCTSLHKWLSAPLGLGLLFVRSDLISSTKRAYSAYAKQKDTMNKFEVLGTRSFALETSLLMALQFNDKIGLKRKTERLQSLTKYWVDGIKDIEKLYTFLPSQYGAIATFEIDGKLKYLTEEYKKQGIFVKKVRASNYNRTRIRVSPNIYHDFEDLDKFIEITKAHMQSI